MPSAELRILSTYIRAIFKYWWLLVGDVVLLLLDATERVLGTWFLPPAWVKILVGVVLLTLAQYLAYRDLAASLSSDSIFQEKLSHLTEQEQRALKELVRERKLRVGNIIYDIIANKSGLIRRDFEGSWRMEEEFRTALLLWADRER
ncbi:MAG TPA: hypothetical protein VE994_10515 [Terriglobales bacterium]|nr:hypothetical protein [Terriglobales bacterium]